MPAQRRILHGCKAHRGVEKSIDTQMQVEKYPERIDTMTMLKHSMDKWKVLAELTKGCKNVGVYVMDRAVALSLLEISIPVTAWLDNAVACVIMGDSLRELSDEQLERILKKNLLTDGAGIQVLTDRGFGHRLGGKIKQVYHTSMAEEMGTHPWNGEYKKYFRDVVMNFGFEADAYEFELSPEEEAVSNLINILHQYVGISMYACRLKNAIDWLSGDTLLVRIMDMKKIVPP